MAYYLVSAEPKQDKLGELEKELKRDAFVDIQPFGNALTDGLRNARTDENGKALWEELDYCSPPLAQERAAVLNDYFVDIEVETVEQGEGWRQIQNLPYLFPKLITQLWQKTKVEK